MHTKSRRDASASRRRSLFWTIVIVLSMVQTSHIIKLHERGIWIENCSLKLETFNERINELEAQSDEAMFVIRSKGLNASQ